MKRTPLLMAGIALVVGSIAIATAALASPSNPRATEGVPAPIDAVDIRVAESWPPQYFLHVVSGLPNGCARFDSYDMVRNGDTIRVEVANLVSAHKGTVCTQVYGTVEHHIALGSDFVSGKTYTVVVNDVTETFVAQ